MNTIRYSVPFVADIKKEWGGKERFNVVSLFAGGGGSSTGYRMAGGKVLAISEFIPEAQNTYSANWPDTLVFKKDIRQTSGLEILSDAGLKKGELDILDGSPPCSAFSTAGSRDKGWGKSKKYSDSSQRVDDLFFEYIRVVRDMEPKVFVAENVSGLIKGAAKGYFNHIIREMRESGYHVECRVLDAKWLGVPQGRQRTIFVGVRDDLYRTGMKLHPNPFGPLIPLKVALIGCDTKSPDISKYAIYKRLIKLKEGEQDAKRFNLVKASRNKPCGCITATAGSVTAASVHHWENRKFSVAEVKRIMSVPDDYVLTGDYGKKVERLGRMVPPFMMKAVAENIYTEVLCGNS